MGEPDLEFEIHALAAHAQTTVVTHGTRPTHATLDFSAEGPPPPKEKNNSSAGVPCLMPWSQCPCQPFISKKAGPHTHAMIAFPWHSLVPVRATSIRPLTHSLKLTVRRMLARRRSCTHTLPSPPSHVPMNRTPVMEVLDTCLDLLQVVHAAVPGLSPTMATRRTMSASDTRSSRLICHGGEAVANAYQVAFDVAPRSRPAQCGLPSIHTFIQPSVEHILGTWSAVRKTSGRTEYFPRVLPLLYRYIHPSRLP